MTEENLDSLAGLYEDLVPLTEDSQLFYLEILSACNGSLTKAISMINETLSVSRSLPEGAGKRKFADESHFHKTKPHKIQKNLNFFISDEKNRTNCRRVDSKLKLSRFPIELHTKEDIEAHVKYLSYHPDFLPAALAGSLLRHVLDKTAGVQPEQFFLFGRQCSKNVQVKGFSCNQDFIDGTTKIYYNAKSNKMAEYNDSLKLAQLLVEDFVNEKIAERKPLPYQIRSPHWKGDVVLANRYERNGSLLWHSDRMTNIGPQPIIASLTLGCARNFNVRRSYPSNSQVYALTPQHNSLVIMYAGFQEEYKHSVPSLPKNKTLDPHPISKYVRINLTYRSYLPKYVKNTPRCLKCQSPMELRRSFKDPAKRGQYIWQCARSYTGIECSGLRIANFNSESLVVENTSQMGSTWVAADDEEAQNANT